MPEEREAFEELLIEVAAKLSELEKKVKSGSVEEIKKVQENLQNQINELTKVVNELATEVKKKRREKDQTLEIFKAAFEEKLKLFEEKLKTLDRIDSIENEIRKLREEREKKEDFFGDLVSAYEKEKQIRVADRVDEIEKRLQHLEEVLKLLKDEIGKIKEIENIKKFEIDIERRVSYLENFLKPDKILKFEQIDNFFNKELPKRLDKEFQLRAENLLKNLKFLESEINRVKAQLLSKSGEVGFILKEVKKISDLEREIEKLKDVEFLRNEVEIIKAKLEHVSKSLNESLQNLNSLNNILQNLKDKNVLEELEKIKIFTAKTEDIKALKSEIEKINYKIQEIKKLEQTVSEIKLNLSTIPKEKIEKIAKDYEGLLKNVSALNSKIELLENKIKDEIENFLKLVLETKNILERTYDELKKIDFEEKKIFELKLTNVSEKMKEIDSLLIKVRSFDEKIQEYKTTLKSYLEKLLEIDVKTSQIIEILNFVKNLVEKERKLFSDEILSLKANLNKLEEELLNVKKHLSESDFLLNLNKANETYSYVEKMFTSIQKIRKEIEKMERMENKINNLEREIERVKENFKYIIEFLKK